MRRLLLVLVLVVILVLMFAGPAFAKGPGDLPGPAFQALFGLYNGLLKYMDVHATQIIYWLLFG